MQEFVTIIVPLAGTVIGSIAGIMTSTRLTNYKIDQIEKKIDDYSDVKERVAILEKGESTQWRRIDELKTDVEALKKGR